MCIDNYKVYIVFFFLCTTLINCGFQLRQSFKLPSAYQRVAIESVNADQIKAMLVASINSKGVENIVIHKNDAETANVLVLKLANENFFNSNSSIVNNDTTGYDINYQLDVSINNETPQTIFISQRINVTPDKVHSNDLLNQQTKTELQQKMLERLMYRIRYAN
ncbi:MAG: hypothetical protein HQL46_06195 [Gammaproteobacteria bacterium]|nr:hypothetical protein [Gammaproteobacteria bacterium]